MSRTPETITFWVKMLGIDLLTVSWKKYGCMTPRDAAPTTDISMVPTTNTWAAPDHDTADGESKSPLVRTRYGITRGNHPRSTSLARIFQCLGVPRQPLKLLETLEI